jgi:hypothetical protein
LRNRWLSSSGRLGTAARLISPGARSHGEPFHSLRERQLGA